MGQEYVDVLARKRKGAQPGTFGYRVIIPPLRSKFCDVCFRREYFVGIRMANVIYATRTMVVDIRR
jgi:hypothetical protein